MTLSEIHKERLNTKLKTKRWHELNQMEKDRTAKINADNGHEANPNHTQGYHRHMARTAGLEGNGLFHYITRSATKHKREHHQKLVDAFKKEDYHVYLG